MNDRIKLVEAMKLFDFEFNRERCPKDWTDDQVWDMCRFNPFTCADDDYAVLEWMRTQYLSKGIVRFGKWTKAISHSIPYSRDYRIGDYARACLKVLDDA